jgi:hypothetical protein
MRCASTTTTWAHMSAPRGKTLSVAFKRTFISIGDRCLAPGMRPTRLLVVVENASIHSSSSALAFSLTLCIVNVHIPDVLKGFKQSEQESRTIKSTAVSSFTKANPKFLKGRVSSKADLVAEINSSSEAGQWHAPEQVRTKMMTIVFDSHQDTEDEKKRRQRIARSSGTDRRRKDPTQDQIKETG